MGKRIVRAAVIAALATSAIAAAQQGSTLRSGVYREYMDTSVRPQDDFFRYVNGKWFASAEIPANRTAIGTWTDLRDQALRNVQAIIETAQTTAAAGNDPIARKIADLYVSFMDEGTIDAAGVAPLAEHIRQIDAVTTPSELARKIGELGNIRVGGMTLDVGPDLKDPTRTRLAMGQFGITLLPDRDYYLKDDQRLTAVRTSYQAYLSKMFELVGRSEAATAAAAVMQLETAMAQHLWPIAEVRDPTKAYNLYTIEKLGTEMPGFDWPAWVAGQGISDPGAVMVAQPSFFKGYAALAQSVPLSTWKSWLVAQLVTAHAGYLGKPFVDVHFEMFGRALVGQQALRPRAERAARFAETSLGEAVGQLYVARHFKPEAKQRMQELVGHLLEAYRDSIASSDWMSAATRQEASTKLSRFVAHIGYPDTWRSYERLVIRPNDLIGNVMRVARFERAYELAKVGKPVDRKEWGMTPQTINAYYSPLDNKIVFPAGILQPPFFDVTADDAVNYGAIGAVIGHEIGHGFDDEGRQFDGSGAMRDWWQPTDDQQFRQRAAQLTEQYDAYAPLPGLHVNGKLTLGENIGDLAGLGLAYRAYQRSLKGRPAPVIDGFTGEQRFFIGFAQIWRRKTTDAQLRNQLLTDPHSPAEYRVNGPVSNLEAFYRNFDVSAGDKMYRAPEKRVRIW